MVMFFNFAAFQLGWFACVLGGAYQLPWIGTGLVLLLIAVHLYAVRPGYQEFLLILAAGVLGTIWDSLLVYNGWMIFPSGILLEGFAPHWLIAIWLLFATTLHVSMRWLQPHLLLAAIFGAIGGPLAYYAGHKLGAVEFADVVDSLIVIGLGWAFIMPLLILLANFFDTPNDVEEALPH